MAVIRRQLSIEEQRRRCVPTEVNNAVHSAWNALAQTVLVENERTLEDLVREMLRPMLRSWLDDNLPTLVERLVLVEIERIARSKPPEHERRDSDILFG
jgi:cell pole-organizing protein PopZ